MQVLVSPIEDFVLGELTETTNVSLIDLTSITCKNANNFELNDFIIVGSIGSETAELKKISSVSTLSTTIRITSTFNFLHEKNEPIRKILYDKKKFYSSATEGGTYNLITDGTVLIDVDSPEGTIFEDINGSLTTWYKVTYYNSHTLIESDILDSEATQASENNHYLTITMIKSEAGFKNNPFISSEEIDQYRVEAESIVDGAISELYTLPLTYVPKIIQLITKQLLAGYLLQKMYGTDQSLQDLGQVKINNATLLLEKIKNKEILLTDNSGAVIMDDKRNLASCSNVFDLDNGRTGDMFNLAGDHFKFTDPDSPYSDSKR